MDIDTPQQHIDIDTLQEHMDIDTPPQQHIPEEVVTDDAKLVPPQQVEVLMPEVLMPWEPEDLNAEVTSFEDDLLNDDLMEALAQQEKTTAMGFDSPAEAPADKDLVMGFDSPAQPPAEAAISSVVDDIAPDSTVPPPAQQQVTVAEPSAPEPVVPMASKPKDTAARSGRRRPRRVQPPPRKIKPLTNFQFAKLESQVERDAKRLQCKPSVLWEVRKKDDPYELQALIRGALFRRRAGALSHDMIVDLQTRIRGCRVRRAFDAEMREVEREREAVREREERERSERERLERERLERERLERERLELQRLEQERIERERQERERLEREELERQELERQKLEQERIERETLERERLERERLEQQRLEQERLQRELEAAQQREQREREERERLAREEQERQDREREAARQREQQEREEREAREREEREAREREEREAREREEREAREREEREARELSAELEQILLDADFGGNGDDGGQETPTTATEPNQTTLVTQATEPAPVAPDQPPPPFTLAPTPNPSRPILQPRSQAIRDRARDSTTIFIRPPPADVMFHQRPTTWTLPEDIPQPTKDTSRKIKPLPKRRAPPKE